MFFFFFFEAGGQQPERPQGERPSFEERARRARRQGRRGSRRQGLGGGKRGAANNPFGTSLSRPRRRVGERPSEYVYDANAVVVKPASGNGSVDPDPVLLVEKGQWEHATLRRDAVQAEVHRGPQGRAHVRDLSGGLRKAKHHDLRAQLLPELPQGSAQDLSRSGQARGRVPKV